MGVDWLDRVLWLNARIIAAEDSISIQLARIAVAADMGEDITQLKRHLLDCRNNLRHLRELRNSILG